MCIVRHDFSTDFFPGVRPPQTQAAAHTQTVVTLTLLRIKLVRARQEDGDYIDPKLEAFVQRHIKLCNGMSTNAIKVLRKRVTKLVVEGMIGMAHAARAMRHGPCRMGNLSYSQVAA